MLKKFCTLIAVIACVIGIAGCAWGGVSLSAFPDPVFREELKRYDYGWTEYDSNGEPYTVGKDDGILSDKEIERITFLGLGFGSSSGITSLDGIKYLTSLKDLRCYSKNMTKLNVSGCTTLERLECEDCQLVELDVSGCTALKYLDCQENQLRELDVSGCVALEILHCYSNKSEMNLLNASGCTSLVYLYCYYSKLKELNVSNCTALMELHCYHNQLEELDVSNLTALTYLNCQENKLSKLDVNGCTALTELDCYNNQLDELILSDCTALERLQCARNQLTELDLSHNTSLDLDFAYKSNACLWQKARDLKVKKTSKGHYEINMKDYVSRLEYIEYADINYNKGTGIATVGCPIASINYGYNTGLVISGKSIIMPVKVTNALSITPFERYGSETYGIICDMTDNSYLDQNGNALTESEIHDYNYSDYGKLGLAADGNSRLILRVETDKPGIASFSLNDDIGAKLESLTSRAEISASDRISTTKLFGYDPLFETYQVSAVLVAPESFPKDKNFPSDTFKIHVKFTDEDGKVTEDDLELKIEAAPVVLIPGMLSMSMISALLNPGDANHTFGRNSNIGIWRELLNVGFKKEHITLFDYNGTNGVKSNVYSLVETLKDIFASYAQEGIVCTKTDVVAHGLGGLLLRQFLDDLDKSDNGYLSSISYKQGMIRRVVNIAVPHRGTPLANVMHGDMSVINNDLPLGKDRLAYRVLELFYSKMGGMPSKEAWRDLAVGSDVVRLPFPANVPMHFIYGDVTSSLDNLEKIKDFAFLIFNLVKLWKTFKDLPKNIEKLQKEIDPLNEEVRQVITGEKYMDNAALEAIAKKANDKELLKLKEFAKALNSFLQSCFSAASFADNFAQDPLFTKLTQIGEVAGVALGSLSGLLTTPIDLYFVIQRLLFSGQPHDTFVPKYSAIAAFPEYSTCFPVTPGILDILFFRYSEICHQAGVAEFVGYLLKSAPLSEFVVLKQSVPLPGSVAENSFSKTMKASSNGNSNGDIEIDFDNFYVKNFGLRIRKSTREDFGNGTAALKFIANANTKTDSDVKLVVQKDGLDRIFPMFTNDGNVFESILIFNSGDVGKMTAYCYAPSNKGNLYISDTVIFYCFDDFEEEEPADNTPPEITVSALPGGAKGTPYSFQLTASGTTPITWSLKSGKMPVGLKLDSSGLISGTPTKAGKFTLTFKAVNSTNKNDTAKLTFQVFDPVSITTASLKAGTIGKSYSVTLKAKGTKPITWSAEGLPSGLTINAKTGRISGKPTEYGQFSVNVTASNGAGSVTRTLSLTVKAIPPTLSGSLKKPTLNVAYSSGLKLSKGTAPITWSISGTLPEGLTFDTETGIISGTPTSYAKSGYKITITAKNDAGSKSKRITLKVNGKAPVIKATLPKTATYGQTYTATLKATGSYPITFTVDRLPDGLSLNDGVISGTVTETTKTFKFTVYAENPVKKVKKSFTIKINNIPKSAKETPPENTDNESGNETPSDNNTVDQTVTDNTETQTQRGNPQTENHSQTESQKSGVPEGYVIVAELGTVSRDEAGMYDFDVALSDDVPAGAELIYIANSDLPSDDDEIAEFFDSTGNEITAVPEDRKISVSIWLNPNTIYHPAIAVKH